MDFEKAIYNLEINKKTKIISKTLIKKQYKKLALLYHPDKNIGKYDNTKFQLINDSYNYLLDNKLYVDEEEDDYIFYSKEDDDEDDYFSSSSSSSTSYFYILKGFISTILLDTGLLDPVFLDEIISIITNGTNEIIIKIFEKLEEDACIKIYSFLYKYRNILFIKDETFFNIQNVIMKKCFTFTNTFILNPNIDDLFDSKCYKMVLYENEIINNFKSSSCSSFDFNNDKENHTFYIPLWVKETYFDNPFIYVCSKKEEKVMIDEEIKFLCIPELEDWIKIDNENNINVNLKIVFDLNLLEQDSIHFFLGKKSFNIHLRNLTFSKNQTHILKGMGISKHNEENIYDDSLKSDIIVNISFVDSDKY